MLLLMLNSTKLTYLAYSVFARRDLIAKDECINFVLIAQRRIFKSIPLFNIILVDYSGLTTKSLAL